MAVERHQRPYGGSGNDPRLEFGKDYDHILYSSAFRRLSGVTQVVGVHETVLFHNRLTHSLKVAQVGRRLANKLLEKVGNNSTLNGVIEAYGGGLDLRVVNAACIAHDLGHPPFGHVAEEALQKILSADPDRISGTSKDIFPRIGSGFAVEDSFEGNAQSFRIVTRLSFRESNEGRGAALNLTKATLAALLKYPWSYKDRPPGVKGHLQYKKWGYYNSEEKFFDFAAEGAIVGREVQDHVGRTWAEYRTIEAQVMDWADDISYAIHDLEDFFRAGLIPLNVLVESDRKFEEFFDYAWGRIEKNFVKPEEGNYQRIAVRAQVRSWIANVRKILPERPYAGTRQDREELHAFASAVIKSATDNVEITERGLVLPNLRDLAVIETFKQMVWKYVIEAPSLASAQRGQVYLIRRLFRDLVAWITMRYTYTISPLPDLPPRLLEFAKIAFDPDPEIGCTRYDTTFQKVARAVVDYIVTLTEAQAIELSSRLSGETSKSILEDWFYA